MGVFVISFKKNVTYKGDVVFKIIGTIINVFVLIALWKYVYSYDTKMVSYMIVYVILTKIIGMFYCGSICADISKKVSNGTFSLELLKPIDFIYMSYLKMLGDICANILLKGIPVICIFGPIIIENLDIINCRNIFAAFLVVILGHFLFSILYSLIGFIAFLCFETWPFERVMNDTIRFLSGAFLPITIFPEWLKKISEYLPFRFLYSLPIEILLDTTNSKNIIYEVFIMCIWVFTLGSLLVCIYKKVVNLYVVQGG